jgi:3-oxoacyl-[acyl-carrier protein] reductase
MKTQKSGVILQVLTTSLDSTPVRMAAYTAGKAGLLGLTYTLAAELGPFGVRSLAVSPHFVETKMLGKFPPKILEIERERLPEKRFLTPEEVAGLMLKMITDEKKFPNGTIRKVYSADDLRV